jgi:hypothetical protein
MNDVFIPNFAYKNFGFKNNKLNLNNQSIRDFSDPAYFERRNLADGGLDVSGKRNNIYDSVSGVIERIPFINKEKLNPLAKKYFSAYLKDESIPSVVKGPYDGAFDKLKESGFYADLDEKETKAKMLLKFEKGNNGDFYNFRGALYESRVAKKVGSEYKLSSSAYARSDLVPVDATIADLFTGIEAKSGATGGNFKILQKAIETAIKEKKLNQDESEDISIGRYALYQTYNDGFIPNFSPLIDDNARNKHDFPKGIASLPIPDKAIQNILDRQQKRQMTYLDFDRTLVRTTGDSAYGRVAPEQKKGVLQKMFLNKEARLKDVKESRLTQFGELLRQKIQQKIIDPSLLGLMTASDETPGMPEYISSIWGIQKRNQVYSAKPGTKETRLAGLGISANGFIPNFAPPISMLRIPWFKKYANPSFDAKQPTLNIAGANAVDTFRSTQFRTNKTDYNKKAGDGNVFGPIYEKFVRSSISLQANKSKIKSLILGQSLEPDTIQGESSFDSFMELVNTNPTDLLDLVGVEIKGGPKDSQSGGSATGIITKKYNNFTTKNPKAAARLRELLGVFNEPGNPQHLQYMSALGKEFLPLACLVYAGILRI